jgi:hypothetical protein
VQLLRLHHPPASAAARYLGVADVLSLTCTFLC